MPVSGSAALPEENPALSAFKCALLPLPGQKSAGKNLPSGRTGLFGSFTFSCAAPSGFSLYPNPRQSFPHPLSGNPRCGG